MNEQKMSKNKLFILLGVAVVAILIIVVAINQGQKNGTGTNEGQAPTTTQNPTATTSAEEVAPSKSVTPQATATPEVLQAAKAMATGTSLITKSNIVVTPQGAPVKLNVMPSSQDAPKESAPVASSTIPNSANTVKISVGSGGFSPRDFTVKAGQLVNFVLTSTDDYTHVWLLDDPSLVGTVLGVAGHETRIKSWNAPKKGSYPFHCDIPGHAGRGETGTMTVN